VIICDTSALVAVYGRVQPVQERLNACSETTLGARPLTFVLAGLDYMVNRDSGVGGELKVLADVAGGVYSLAEFSRADVAQAAGWSSGTPTCALAWLMRPSSFSPPGTARPGY